MTQEMKQKVSNIIAKIVQEEGIYSTRSYSGRGMYGESCLGINVSKTSDIFKLGVLLEAYTNIDRSVLHPTDADILEESLPYLASSLTTDQMGLGMVVYFPSFPPPENEKNEENI